MPNTTKRLLAASLKRLLSGKTLDCITIQDITDDAEVSRKTFYYHFQDIYDLLSWMLREELRRVISLPITQENAWEQIGSILTYMLQNRMLMLNVYHSVQREVLEKEISTQLQPIIEGLFDSVPGSERLAADDRRFLVDIYVFGICGLTLHWIATGMDENIEPICERIFRLLGGSVEDAIRRYMD